MRLPWARGVSLPHNRTRQPGIKADSSKEIGGRIVGNTGKILLACGVVVTIVGGVTKQRTRVFSFFPRSRPGQIVNHKQVLESFVMGFKA
jgi:hypothetical protein